MARIRTIKPEFFTSEDIVSLSPLARLLYIALWCEADKDGRMVWKPVTFRLRYLPGDSCDINALCVEILSRGLIVLYGDGFAHIPAFSAHQHVNPREAASQLPDPDAIVTRGARVGTRGARVGTRGELENKVSDAQVGREGKGRERKGGSVDASHDAQPPPFLPEFREVIETERPDLDAELVFANFCSHYQPEKQTLPQWRKWVKNEFAGPQSVGPPSTADPESRASIEALGLSLGIGRWDELKEHWTSYKNRVKGVPA